jgi:hypothetical protein
VNKVSQQMVRITSLAKTLDTLENAAEGLLQSGMIYRTAEEIEAFMKGFRSALDLVRREYGIKP